MSNEYYHRVLIRILNLMFLGFRVHLLRFGTDFQSIKFTALYLSFCIDQYLTQEAYNGTIIILYAPSKDEYPLTIEVNK